jgi:hypothetical protein
MGNCVKRETGLEMEDTTDTNVDVEELKKKIIKMKNCWKNRLERQLTFLELEEKKENILESINNSELKDDSEDVSKLHKGRRTSSNKKIIKYSRNLHQSEDLFMFNTTQKTEIPEQQLHKDLTFYHNGNKNNRSLNKEESIKSHRSINSSGNSLMYSHKNYEEDKKVRNREEDDYSISRYRK